VDIPELPLSYMDSGREYEASLRKLGLRPDGLAWGWDGIEQGFFLFLIWGGVDIVGPLSVGEVLFKAYNHSALPKEIDPFRVMAVGPKHAVAAAMIDSWHDKDTKYLRNTPSPDPEKYWVHFQKDWTISMLRKPHKSLDIKADWRRFTQRVNALAA
jgi:hypothetical protein